MRSFFNFVQSFVHIIRPVFLNDHRRKSTGRLIQKAGYSRKSTNTKHFLTAELIAKGNGLDVHACLACQYQNKHRLIKEGITYSTYTAEQKIFFVYIVCSFVEIRLFISRVIYRLCRCILALVVTSGRN